MAKSGKTTWIVLGAVALVLLLLIGGFAAIGIWAFTDYVRSSKTAEATVSIAELRNRLEAYRADFGQYPASLPPTPPRPGPEPQAWPSDPRWEELGFEPDGAVRYSYEVITGPPGEDPAVPGSVPDDFWYVIRVRGDLDGDGELSLFEAYSARSSLHIENETE